MGNKKRIIITLGTIIVAIVCIIVISFIFRPLKVMNIVYTLKGKNIYAEIKIDGNTKNAKCIYNEQEVNVTNHKCTILVKDEPSNVKIVGSRNTITQEVQPNINEIIDFTLSDDKLYLTLEEEKEITFSVETIGNPSETIVLTSENPQIAEVHDNVIKGLQPGKTTVIAKALNKSKTIDVTVTDLITKPIWKGQDKKLVPCHAYTEEEAALLEEILEYRVNKAGYRTRAATVAAARFLTLEFPYRVPYFYENGRIHESGVNFVDAEGRYYHKGLYLADSKMADKKPNYTGPAIWGCPLRNLEDSTLNGYHVGEMKPNGLDCSGFVSWVMKQAGFETGDIGAVMFAEEAGEYLPLTYEVINSGRIRVGDLFSYWGHISILVGIEGDNYYIAESLPGPRFDGVTVKKYTKQNVNQTFVNVTIMDDLYKEDGTISEYWE